jgi:hypothetical protein
VEADDKVALESRLPMRAYRALGIELGATVAFSLRRDSIMLLPRDQESSG